MSADAARWSCPRRRVSVGRIDRCAALIGFEITRTPEAAEAGAPVRA
jgi:hypothetical protein